MQSLILVETLANGSKRSHPLSHSAKITVQAGASYAVIDTTTGKAPAGLQLQRDGDALKVVVDQETVARLQDFYREDITAEVTSDGTVTVATDALITGTSAEMTGASSGDGAGSSFLTVAGSIGLGAVIGGGAFVAFNDFKDNDGDDVPVRQTGLVNESVVVFDLINGDSSSHSGRTFDADTAYVIIIVIDSTGDEMLQPDMWSGAQNLGSDDVIILVGNGETILGHSGNSISDINFNKFTPGTVSWATGLITTNTMQLAAFMFPSGEFRNQSFDVVDLWEGSVPGAMSNLSGFGWAISLPNAIRSSQGL